MEMQETVSKIKHPKGKAEIIREIQLLRKEKNAVILAHYYQEGDIQDIADFVGDSLGLSQNAAETNADMIVFAGVHFMAETAKILNPHKKVVLPDKNAGCSLADSCPPDQFKEFVEAHQDYAVISYINCSAEIKALSDVICTSSNAEKVIRSIPDDQKIIFAPDKNLGQYLMTKTGRDMLLWDGVCIVHEAFSMEKLMLLMAEYPGAPLIAHPESEKHLLRYADFIGSTTALINYVNQSEKSTFLIATEAGILHQMKKEAPHKEIIPVPVKEDNTCACSECAFMKMNTLEKLYLCLKHEKPEILIPEELRLRALKPVQRMLELK